MSSADSVSSREISRATSSIVKGAAARLIGRKLPPNTDPIHKHSYDVDDERAQPWRRGRIGDGDRDRWRATWRALRLTLQEDIVRHKQDGVKGPERLQANDLLVLDALLDFYRHETGKLFPEQQTLADDTGLDRKTVIASLARLRANGYLTWVRRSCPTGNAGQAGPQRRQTSNAYYFDWRRKMAARVWARFQQLLRRFLAKLGQHLGVPAAPAAPSPALAAALAGLAAAGDKVWSASPE